MGMVLLAPFVICAGLDGCCAEKYADLEYSNESYSYEKTDSFQYDSWCRYDDAYLDKLREDSLFALFPQEVVSLFSTKKGCST